MSNEGCIPSMHITDFAISYVPQIEAEPGEIFRLQVQKSFDERNTTDSHAFWQAVNFVQSQVSSDQNLCDDLGKWSPNSGYLCNIDHLYEETPALMNHFYRSAIMAIGVLSSVILSM